MSNPGPPALCTASQVPAGLILERTEKRLSDEEFLSKAPEDIVEKQKKRQEENSEKLQTIRKRIAMLQEIR